jgi:putative ATP-binding cassette transporter
MDLIAFLARSSRTRLCLALSASLLGGAGAALLVALINEALEAPASALPRLGLQFAALALCMLGFRWLSQAEFVELSEATLARLRVHISRSLAEAPLRNLEAWGQGRLLTVLTEDIGAVSDFFVTLPRFAMHGAVVLGCLVYLAWLSWSVFAFAAAVVALGLLGHLWGARRANYHLGRARLEEDRLMDHFRALFVGAKELKLNARRRGAFFSDVLAPSVQSARREHTQGYAIHAASGSVRIFLFYLVIGGVLFLFGEGFGVDERVRSGYAVMFLYMMLPLHALIEASPEISRTKVALQRIQSLGALEPPNALLPAAAPPFSGLHLSGVTYVHRQGEDVLFQLGPISLELRPGEVVFVVGGNGSGKTTLAKLLVGLYEHEAGRISLNGVSVEADSRESYRQNFAAVFTDFHLFSRLLGITGKELDQRVHELLSAFDLEHKLSVRDGVFSTTALSSGQQKRLALLVAFLEDRPIYLFDEWAADQDPAYKRVFYERVLPELKQLGKAVVVITHDDRYFHLADRRLVLEGGLLREPPA